MDAPNRHEQLPDSGRAAVVEACRLIEADLSQPPSVPALAAACGLSASGLRRAFGRVLGVTPTAYMQRARLDAFANSPARQVTDAIFDAGFSSPSRFYAQAGALGMPPARFKRGGAGEVLRFATAPTVVGTLIVAASRWGVACVQLAADDAAAETALRERFPAAECEPGPDDRDLADWTQAVQRMVDHSTDAPDIPLDIRGTAFQRRVWDALQAIPRGQTRSYAEVARTIAAPDAVRAVGTACGANRLAIVVPCHRVLRADGSMGGYRWGIARKQALLAREQTGDVPGA